MNERIKELVYEANPASKEIYESDSWQFNCAAWSAEDLKKFTKLVVKECVRVVDETMTENQEMNIGLVMASAAIVSHFEIEE